MLKLRILTALILGPFILWSVIAFSHRAIAVELGIVLLLAAWEWGRLAGLDNQYARIFYALSLGILMTLVSLTLHIYPDWLMPLLLVTVACWVCCISWLIWAEKTGVQQIKTFSQPVRALNLGIGSIILLGTFVAIVGLHQSAHYGPYYIIVLLILIWLADSAAYFTGKALGKHKLAPHISPGKTWEGVAGAMLATFIAAVLLALLLSRKGSGIFVFVVIAMASIVFSIGGDLFESLFKRRVGIKDSSRILPGHGGILDRIDSLLAAAPVFYLGLMLTEVP